MMGGSNIVPSIPIWVKNITGWWSDGKIDNSNFLVGVNYMIDHNIITMAHRENHVSGIRSEFVPVWIKNAAGWWSNGEISSEEFANELQYLMKNNIMRT